MSQAFESALAEMSALLDEERVALLAGDFEKIAALADRKTSLIDVLAGAMPEDGEALEPLQVKLRRNRALFEEALAGLRSVSERLADLREMSRGGETYDGDGRRLSIDTALVGRLEKRA